MRQSVDSLIRCRHSNTSNKYSLGHLEHSALHHILSELIRFPHSLSLSLFLVCDWYLVFIPALMVLFSSFSRAGVTFVNCDLLCCWCFGCAPVVWGSFQTLSTDSTSVCCCRWCCLLFCASLLFSLSLSVEEKDKRHRYDDRKKNRQKRKMRLRPAQRLVLHCRLHGPRRAVEQGHTGQKRRQPTSKNPAMRVTNSTGDD